MLSPWDPTNLKISGFDSRLETKIIVPGWLDNLNRALWVRYMKDAFQWLWTPVNLIVIKWRNFTPYTIATANTRVVGAELANLLKFIEKELKYDRSYFHIIGHSLGAHIAGYCGDRLPGLGRITALDPARPFFQHMPKKVRLDRGDARFVDAIHSDFTPENAIFLLMSFGMTTPVGHVDFYPNGPPLLQPGCLRDTLLSVQNGIRRGLRHSSLVIAFQESIRYLIACDHQRSHEWFLESIVNRQCVFVGVRCNEFEGLINGRCTCDDSPGACAIMGIHADQMYMNNLHNHIWPKTKGGPHLDNYHHDQRWRNRYPPGQYPHSPHDGYTRDQAYVRLKHQAHQIRQPPGPWMIHTDDGFDSDYLQPQLPEDLHPKKPPYLYDDATFESIGSDEMFVTYLKALLLDEQADRKLVQNAQSQSVPDIFQDPVKYDDRMLFQTRRLEREEDIIMMTTKASRDLHMTASHMPKLMSDYDRDIEEWYEDNSRWHLRTQDRPTYCANQYQVLVFIGPLRTGSGKFREARLRSNLMISIIGTRGQLINQRFVPRSAQLDSYTMQPFYIILEGSYSLGKITSVAISWEARYDPDPVQATVTFQSNLLEAAQPFIPSYKAKSPLLPSRFDQSAALKWPSLKDDVIERLKRSKRQTEKFGTRQIDKKTNVVSKDYFDRGLDGDSIDISDTNNELELTDQISDIVELPLVAPTLQQAEIDLLEVQGPILNVPSLETNRDYQRDSQLSLYPLGETMKADPTHWENSGKVTAEFHNIENLLNDDPETTIVIKEVIVSPVEAHYGRAGRISKVFCPPHLDFRLRRDQTVKLTLDLFGQCHQQFNRVLHPILSR